MTYMNKNWDVPLLYKDRALEKAAHDCVVRAVAKVRSIPAHKIHTKKVLAHPALVGYCNQRKQRWSAYVVHTRDMSRQGGVSIVPDDKNKKHAWRMPTHVYHTLLAFFVLFSSNWAMTGISADTANNLCLDAILAMVPQHLLGFLGLKQGVWLIPFVYATIKSKCFSSTGRRCMKHGHSCVRKVISFATWPKKDLLEDGFPRIANCATEKLFQLASVAYERCASRSATESQGLGCSAEPFDLLSVWHSKAEVSSYCARCWAILRVRDSSRFVKFCA